MLLFMISVDFAGDIMTSFNNFAALERQIIKDITDNNFVLKDVVKINTVKEIINYTKTDE